MPQDHLAILHRLSNSKANFLTIVSFSSPCWIWNSHHRSKSSLLSCLHGMADRRRGDIIDSNLNSIQIWLYSNSNLIHDNSDPCQSDLYLHSANHNISSIDQVSFSQLSLTQFSHAQTDFTDRPVKSSKLFHTRFRLDSGQIRGLHFSDCSGVLKARLNLQL